MNILGNNRVNSKSEPIIAYRIWRINLDTCLLTSYYKDDIIWQPGKMMKSHQLPSLYVGPGIGIHAWKSQKRLVEYPLTSGIGTDYIIYGTTYLWGQISEFERGYTAEFAYPRSFDILAPYHEDLAPKIIDRKQIETKLRNLYGCEVGDFMFSGIKTYEDGTVIYFENGVFHKEDGYAIEYPLITGTICDGQYYNHGRLGRTLASFEQKLNPVNCTGIQIVSGPGTSSGNSLVSSLNPVTSFTTIPTMTLSPGDVFSYTYTFL